MIFFLCSIFVFFICFANRLDHFDIEPGIHAIMSLEESNHPSNQLIGTQEICDIVLIYWPIDDAFERVRSSNSTTVFVRAMHEICDTVCVPVTKQDVSLFFLFCFSISVLAC